MKCRISADAYDIHVRMFFENLAQLKALSEVKVVPKESFVLNALLRLYDTVSNECVAYDFRPHRLTIR